MPITNLSKINTWEDLAWMDIIFLSPLPLLLPPVSIVLSLKRLVYGDVAITLNVNAGLSAVPCMCVCDSNGAKAQSHSPSSQVGKQLSGLWLLAASSWCCVFWKCRAINPQVISVLCTYPSAVLLMELFFFSLRVAGITCAFHLTVSKSFYFIIYFVTKTEIHFIYSSGRSQLKKLCLSFCFYHQILTLTERHFFERT